MVKIAVAEVLLCHILLTAAGLPRLFENSRITGAAGCGREKMLNECAAPNALKASPSGGVF